MNIKIVFNKKIHKLSAKYQTYDQVINGIVLLYPQLKDGMHLFISLSPSNSFKQKDNPPIEITSEYIFSTVQKLYKENGWDGVKILVKDKNSSQLNDDDLNVLNQSLIQKQQQNSSQINMSIPPLQKVQKEEETPTKLPDLQKPPQTNNDYLQQIDQLKQLQQQNVELFVNKQQGQQEEQFQKLERVDSLVSDVIDSQKQGSQLDQNQQLIEYLSELIDERLKFHGLLQLQVNKLQPEVQVPKVSPILKMRLVESNSQIRYGYDCLDLTFILRIENLSNIPWLKGQVTIQGFSVPLNKSYDIGDDVKVNGCINKMLNLQVPYEYITNQQELTYEFKLVHEKTPFGQKMIFIVKLDKKLLNDALSAYDTKRKQIEETQKRIQQNDYKQDILIQNANILRQQNVKFLMDIMSIDQQKAAELLDNNKGKQVQDIIDEYFAQL